ncbi:MAG TPA: NAD(P)/FAD-dependent oxidoreductase [Ktedonobacterales bacterium]|jgi:flavin-dependent dehydrogenase
MPLTVGQKGDVYDVIVVGASFAGLSFASVAAARGLRVLALEKDAEIGGVVRTTGVLFSDVLDVTDVPARYLMNSVRRVSLRAPNRAEPIEISASAYRFYMVDVTGMLRWMAEEAQARGATIRSGAAFLDASRDEDGLMQVTFGALPEHEAKGVTPGTRETARARLLVGADGPRSTVAQRLGLDQNTHFLAGAEWLVEGVPVDRETFFLIMNHDLAPGYCLWLAPHGDLAALGVAGHLRKFNPTESLRVAQTLFGEQIDMSQMRVVKRKGGTIPVGGRLRRVYRDDARGRALLLGDAAGLCGAATGGGIYPALISGRLAAQAVANEILNGVPGSVKNYLRDLPHAGRLGHYLQIEDWLRWALDRIGSNTDLTAFYGLFGTSEGHQVLQRTLLETPIIGMDSGFFSMIRLLLSKHPRIYGSAVRMAWQRVTTRA